MKFTHHAAGTGAALLLLFAWDASALDLTLAHWAGGTTGFTYRHHWLLTTVLHDGTRIAAWAMVVVLSAAVAWPVGPLRGLSTARRLQLPVSALVATAAVSALKAFSGTSCPWDLAEFGGVAHHLSHWQGWLGADGGSGHCFPAGHASSGFAFTGGWFAWREHAPALAAGWLAGAVMLGFSLGAAQQWRGAHFMSHTLWTAWICWAVGGLLDPVFTRAEARGQP